MSDKRIFRYAWRDLLRYAMFNMALAIVIPVVSCPVSLAMYLFWDNIYFVSLSAVICDVSVYYLLYKAFYRQ